MTASTRTGTCGLLAALAVTGVISGCGDGSAALADALPAPSRDGWLAAEAWPGFTLLTPLQSKRVYLVDMAGEAVHTWDTAAKPGLAVYLTEHGTLLKCHRVEDHPVFDDAGGNGGWIQEIDWDGTVLWDFRWDGEQGLSHHDIAPLPNGNLLFLAWDRVPRERALAAGRAPELVAAEEFWPGAVYEVRPTPPVGGEIVWSWHALDHVVQDRDPELPDFSAARLRPERIDINGDWSPEPLTDEDRAADQEHMAALGYAGGDEESAADGDEDWQVQTSDWLHMNGIDYHPGLDQIALSVRNYNEVWIIDHGTTTGEAAGPAGDLLYRWGNPYASGLGPWSERRLFHQHNVQWIPEGRLGAGNLLVFNNGGRGRESSSVEEWWPPRDADGRYPRAKGAAGGPQRSEWSYRGDPPETVYSPFISGVQRLPNGNTLVCSGEEGRVFEVDLDGRVVWDWSSPFGPDPDEREEGNTDLPTAMFRAERYAPDHAGIVALRGKGAKIPLDPGAR